MISLLLLLPAAAAVGRVCNLMLDFNAAGDNRTEDTATLRSALASCSTVLLPRGHVSGLQNLGQKRFSAPGKQ